jgi:hypothetical protein
MTAIDLDQAAKLAAEALLVDCAHPPPYDEEYCLNHKERYSIASAIESGELVFIRRAERDALAAVADAVRAHFKASDPGQPGGPDLYHTAYRMVLAIAALDKAGEAPGGREAWA